MLLKTPEVKLDTGTKAVIEKRAGAIFQTPRNVTTVDQVANATEVATDTSTKSDKIVRAEIQSKNLTVTPP